MGMIVFPPSKRMVNAIFKAYKDGRIEVSKSDINALYDFADNGWEQFTRHDQGLMDASIHRTLDALFSPINEDTEAQKHIDTFAKHLEGARGHKKFDGDAAVRAILIAAGKPLPPALA